tara:strand:+ start:120 stop:722 length:603 start_codon:yes stop_codon:yes gene_type:complete
VSYHKKKLLLLQVIIFIFACSLIYFSYYNQNVQVSNVKIEESKKSSKNKKTDELKNNNAFENIEYNGIDLNGNRYQIKSERADFDIDNPSLIRMKIMNSIFYFKDGTILNVTGDYGTYNNKTNDMIFRDNIVALYLNHKLIADNLDYFNVKGLINVYGNVKSESKEGNIEADNAEIDLKKKTIDLNMFDNNEVKVKLNTK